MDEGNDGVHRYHFERNFVNISTYFIGEMEVCMVYKRMIINTLQNIQLQNIQFEIRKDEISGWFVFWSED